MAASSRSGGRGRGAGECLDLRAAEQGDGGDLEAAQRDGGEHDGHAGTRGPGKRLPLDLGGLEVLAGVLGHPPHGVLPEDRLEQLGAHHAGAAGDADAEHRVVDRERADDTEQQQALYASQRQTMVERQIAARGIRTPPVLNAMGKVPREMFVPTNLRDRAYRDAPLPIAADQTISQPYIVAYMTDALELIGGERVLEIGTGSGYAAAVLAEIASDVYTLERHHSLATQARKTLQAQGYGSVKVIEGDGTLGWPDAAPYDAIIVAAGGPGIPPALKAQLAIGGRLVIPVGESETVQALIRVVRIDQSEYREEHLTDVRFVPLVGEAGWRDKTASANAAGGACVAKLIPKRRHTASMATSALIAEAAEPFTTIDQADLQSLLGRIGDARVVLIGEASHGTSEFYRFRARITRELIEKKGFSFVAAEADWPDAARIDHYVRDKQTPPAEWNAFTRFPTWMWRNEEVREFVDWLRQFNAGIENREKRIGFYGLDLYSLFTSIEAVLGYLDEVDHKAAKIARERYGCLMPWEHDLSTYGRAAVSGRYRECQDDVVAMLMTLLSKRLAYTEHDGARFMDAVQNARLVANAERYYRSMYVGYSESWNLRDQHMFDTLQALMVFGGETAKAVVWEHNSHIGDASATDMVARGQLNVGQLCREVYGKDAYLIGFGTHSGTVAAASDWDEPMEIKQVRPSLNGSWEQLCHASEVPAFLLNLRRSKADPLTKRLKQWQLERAIGVIYRPKTERGSHYFKARLADQFDEYVWFDETRAVVPLDTQLLKEMPDTYPFGI